MANKTIFPGLLAATTLAIFTSALAMADTTESITWQDWGKAPFEQARQENKIILVNVGMEGCAACYRMEAITYADLDVIALMEQHFVSIAVDSEARPDIGERYSDWAWPATIFLAPDTTQVLAVRGNRMPRNFIPILKDLIAKQASGELRPDPKSPYAAAPEPATTELTLTRDRLRAQIDRNLNEEFGGWGRWGIGGEQSGSRLKHLYLRAHMYDNANLRALALKGSAGYLRNIDPVWGGVYSASFPDDLEGIPAKFKGVRAIPEKRISAQANAIVGFAIAYELSGDARYIKGMQAMDRFMRDWFTGPDGTFYTNQRNQPPKLPDGMSAGEYWALDSDQARRKYGTPPVDHAVYTDKNGEMILAYVMAYEAFGEATYLETAQRAANALLRARSHPAGWILQALDNQEMSQDQRLRPYPTDARPFLSAQAWFGRALLALYRATGEAHWLEQATTIGLATLATMEDQKLGGFYATALDDSAAFIAPRKSLEANGTAAHFFYDLWVYSKDERFAEVPERTLRAVADPASIRREGKITGELALAFEKVTASYVEFSVVGDLDQVETQALFAAGRETYHPRKLLHYEQPGRYPAQKKPAMYICNPDVCSVPIEDPELVQSQAALFRKPASG
jgi:uncharacterized protein YyaL (SSP411 family)